MARGILLATLGLALVSSLAACTEAGDAAGSGGAGRGAGGSSAGSAGSGIGAAGSSAGGKGSGVGGGSGGSAGTSVTGGGAGVGPTSGGASGASGASAGSAGTTDDGGEGGVGADGGKGGGAGASGRGGAGGGAGKGSSTYDAVVLADGPVLYLAMAHAGATEPDLSGHGHVGTYVAGAPGDATMPNGDAAADFDGDEQYLTVPSHASFSIPTTGNLTWEAWIRPDVVEFPNATSGGYVDWMGKCEEYGPTCEWQGRIYSLTNSEDRCNRMSAYVFNPDAGLGSGAYWQGECGIIEAGTFYHVVGQYTTESQPAGCQNSDMYPGSIEIWVNGVKWNQASHGQTGCFGQYEIVPEANDSAVNIGTMAEDSFFLGAIGKFAIYDKLLTQAQISNHYRTMTGADPTGSCQNSCSF